MSSNRSVSLMDMQGSATVKISTSTLSDTTRDKNPFTVPTEYEIRAMKSLEKEAKKASKEKLKTMKVHQKLGLQSIKPSIKALTADEEPGMVEEQRAVTKPVTARERQIEKETLIEYINKKREMFLVQYSLGVKRDEMAKLEQLSKRETNKMSQAELKIYQEGAKFENFLQENDKASVEAIKQAEIQTKIKLQKVTEAKRLIAEIETVNSDISKNYERLKDFIAYRNFLDTLSPESWLKEQEELAQKNDKITQRLVWPSHNVVDHKKELLAPGHARPSLLRKCLQGIGFNSNATPLVVNQPGGAGFPRSGITEDKMAAPVDAALLDLLEQLLPDFFFHRASTGARGAI